VAVGSIRGNWPRDIRKSTQLVFQKPDSTLNPAHTVFAALARPLRLFSGTPKNSMRTGVLRLLRTVGLSERHIDSLPHQLSGGERQRVAIARAFATSPRLVLCDEPTSALDVSVQARILNLLRKLQDEAGVSYVFISHDLSVVRHLADRIVVLFRGQIVESGSTDEVFSPPFHPYTETLIRSVATLSGGRTKAGEPRQGSVEGEGGIGCSFYFRCPRRLERLCNVETPPNQSSQSGHQIACHIPVADLTRSQSATWQ
jgi:peptide/nickel transport system ATP-binding protein